MELPLLGLPRVPAEETPGAAELPPTPYPAPQSLQSSTKEAQRPRRSKKWASLIEREETSDRSEPCPRTPHRFGDTPLDGHPLTEPPRRPYTRATDPPAKLDPAVQCDFCHPVDNRRGPIHTLAPAVRGHPVKLRRTQYGGPRSRPRTGKAHLGRPVPAGRIQCVHRLSSRAVKVRCPTRRAPRLRRP